LEEEWRFHPNYGDKYMFSNLGRVKRMPYIKDRIFSSGPKPRLYNEKILVGKKLSPKGYKRVNLEGSVRFVHQLICEVFHGSKPSPRHQVNHKNGTKTDNRESNLEWVTNQENRDHAVANNLHPCRENGFCLVPMSEVPKILDRYNKGESYKEIAKDYPVKAGAIGSIVRKYKDKINEKHLSMP
tara:strand:- start:917 stop:1468 length:552 start_codon:yes stop_codon:yes gene_type:complete